MIEYDINPVWGKSDEPDPNDLVDWEVRIKYPGRHNGKLLCTCPHLAIADAIVNALSHMDSVTGLSNNWLDVLFEVREMPTPKLEITPDETK